MKWIVKVGDAYLWRFRGRSAECKKEQRSALRFSDEGHAYRVAAKTFGLSDGSDDDDFTARVVKLVPKRLSELPGVGEVKP